MTVCKNCTLEFEGKYCSACGQKASTKRFSTRILFSQLMDKLLPLDRGVLHTAWHVLSKPGKMLRGYLAGKRVGYTKPLQLLFIVMAISLLFFSMDEFKRGMATGMGDAGTKAPNAETMAFQQKLADFITEHMTLLMLGILPFLAMVSRWFYRKHDVNLAEQFVLNSYLLAGCTIISMPFMLILRLMGESSFSGYAMGMFMVFYVGYYAWAHISFYQERNRILNALKGVFTFILSYLMYILFAGIVGVIAVTVYFLLVKKG